MASNINTTYFQHWKDFSLLGQSMNKYAIASWISLAAGFFGNFIIQFVIIGPMMAAMESGTFDDPYAMLIGMGGILLFFVLIMLAISIYQLITYIQYLMQLKKVGENTNDINLQKAYKMELWAMIISVIIMIVILPAMLLLILSLGNLMNITTESELFAFLQLLFGFLFVVIIIALTSIVLQVLSVSAFDRWGQGIKMANYQNPNAGNIAEGTNFMRIGRILSLFVGSIGSILFLIGFMKVGKNMTEFFEGYGKYQLSQGSASPQSSGSRTFQQPRSYTTNTTNPNLNSSSMGNTSYGNTTMKPQGEGFCPYCGLELQDKNSMFCSNCGRKLI